MNDEVVSVTEDGVVIFWCAGCREHHGVWTTSPNPKTGARWTWNHDKVRPTFNPSVVVSHEGNYPRCHSFVRDGQIQYLSDCGHNLAGSTVALTPIDEPYDPPHADTGDHVLSTEGNVVHVSETAGGFADGIRPPP